MTLQHLISHLLINVIFVQTKETHNIDYVFFEMAPYIYYKNGTLHGAIVDVFERFYAMCNVKYTLKYDVKNIQNMTDIIESSSEQSYIFNNKTWWLPLTYTVNNDFTKNRGLHIREEYWAMGIEVVMHRQQIALLVKIWGAILDCRHIISLVIVLTLCFGILIWIAVSESLIFLIRFQ